MAVRTLLRALRSRIDPGASAPGAEGSSVDFDPAFYRDAYADLANLPDDAALLRHYQRFGAAEGRHPNRDAGLNALAALGLRPPEDFDPDDYMARNPDLGASLKSRWEALEHYVRYGRDEGRSYGDLDIDLYGAMYFPGEDRTPAELLQDYETHGRALRRAKNAGSLQRSLGLPGHGAWLKAIKPREFAMVNWSWAGQATTLPQVIEAMLREGVDRLAPVALDRVFEVAYWREANPALGAAPDAELYKDWLFRGLDLGMPGNATDRLRQLQLPLESFPEAFDWRLYSRAGEKYGSRWKALEAVLADDRASAADVRLTGHGDAVGFLSALARPAVLRSRARALALLNRAKSLGPLDATAQQVLGENLQALGRHREAFDAYRELAETGQADMGVIINAVHAARAVDRHDDALDLLTAVRDSLAGNALFRRIASEAVDGWFQFHSNEVRRKYVMGRRARADAANVALADAAAARLEALDPLGAPMPATSEGRVVMLANVDLRQCTYYRVEQKVEVFAAAGRPIEVFPAHDIEGFMAALPGASAAIFYRTAAFPQILRAIDYARALGVVTYYEIDDLIFEDAYPDPIESYGGSVTKEFYAGLLWGVPLFRLAMSRCDYGIASTTALARHMETVVRTGEVFVLPNALDHRNDEFIARPARVRRGDEVVLFYASGTKAHNSDFLDLAGPALEELLSTRPHLRLVVVGYLTLDARLERLRDRITTVPFIPEARGLWSLLAEADVNLAVLAPGVVADAKSEIKWLEAAVLGVPSVLSATDRYREVIDDGVDGLLVTDAASWREALFRMVDDSELRRRIGDAARAKALANYNVEAGAARVRTLLGPADARRSTEGARRPRVLLVNAFFPPQTIGGATRVVRDNLADFLADSGNRFDFAVACTDHQATPAYALRVEDHHGCPVFRISTPEEVNMDWNPKDALLGDVFGEFLDSWRPDLVHFHAVQRWTAAAVEACVRAGIRYVVTAHDAWWLSDHQFLIDDRGALQDPCAALPNRPPAPASIGDSLARRRYLAALLDSAQRVIGVSQTFADIYAACGVPRVVAIPNGVPPARVLPRRRSPNGRVRLAHVGGMSAHKGYDLLQAVLRQSRYRNLSLTVIDHARYGGETRHEIWGSTPVRIVGKSSADGMSGFYAEHDVLLAPSIWPESYGLVAREALNAGLWVVAGDRGAMSEDVQPGVNGFVVDVGAPDALAGALAEIDADPQRYLATPPPTPLRPAQAQARELLALYEEVLAEPRVDPAPIPTWAGENRRGDDAPTTLAVLRRRRERARWGRMTTAGAPLD